MLARSVRAAWVEHGAVGELIPVSRTDADLRDAVATRELFERVKPGVVIHAAAKVGGIAANIADPTSFLMDNLQLDSSVLEAARAVGTRNFLYLGSSCMYPKDYRQPLVESDILAGPLEPTNEGYALSKIVAAKYCEYASRQFGLNYKVIIPSNLYGPDDDYSLSFGHLVAATIAKAHAAKVAKSASIDVWGDGTARREFTFVGDLAMWIVKNLGSMEAWPDLMNVGFGEDHSVLDYYRMALGVVGYESELVTDPSKPVGMHQKLMNSELARRHGWAPTTGMIQGMGIAYERYLVSIAESETPTRWSEPKR
jgi:GDP-L-fucose synthase